MAGFFVAQYASAQPATGSVSGVVRDASGAPVAGVQLALKNLGNDKTLNAKSDETGAYRIPNLTAGSYEISASKYGFTDAKFRIAIDARHPAHLEMKLKLAAVTEEAAAAETQKLEALAQRIDQLEAELQKKNAEAAAASSSQVPHGPLVATLTKDQNQIAMAPGALPPPDLSKTVATNTASPNAPINANAPTPQQPVVASNAGQNQAPAAPAVDLQTPFAYADFTWLNGTPRNKDVVLDTPFFTPEVRFDTHYMEDFNQPVDHTIVGATESFRSGEVQIEQASVGGDFHWQNVRGRILFMMGLFSTTTPRNDASSATGSAAGNTGGVGQWDLQNAYKYVSEAYGGYHFNVQHGLNVDAGIFVSYIGLFSYYNFDNWTYQPSYVSSNTPWFFNGVRVQWFPTNKLKIEPWFINGWQSYAKFNGHPGLGGQLLWMPTEWFKLVANQYGYGQDNLGLPHTERIHTDDSIEVRYFNRPESLNLSKMAFSLTADAGCQYGGGLSCTGGRNTTQKSSFVGWMLYDRMWFHKDLFAITMGGGEMSNWGRYLTLLPPIDGAWAASGSAYFPELPGQRAHMWDSTVTLHYMPKQYITWWLEAGYRHSDIPYFAGRGGVTPPGGNNGLPQYYTCMSGASAGTAVLSAAQSACGGLGGVWYPDLRRSEMKLSIGVMVKF
ncbi:MAG TPA: outer membrane beta-barrel protein [Bryobacteraceae bacterium]|nr:outer membrane beta-barrel protein [Bryobacteraceae bacterium]